MNATKYLYTGIAILAASRIIVIYLNFQGVRCLSDLARVDRSIAPPELVEEMEGNCAITTNYTSIPIYGVVAGIVLVVVGFYEKEGGHAS